MKWLCLCPCVCRYNLIISEISYDHSYLAKRWPCKGAILVLIFEFIWTYLSVIWFWGRAEEDSSYFHLIITFLFRFFLVLSNSLWAFFYLKFLFYCVGFLKKTNNAAILRKCFTCEALIARSKWIVENILFRFSYLPHTTVVSHIEIICTISRSTPVFIKLTIFIM